MAGPTRAGEPCRPRRRWTAAWLMLCAVALSACALPALGGGATPTLPPPRLVTATSSPTLTVVVTGAAGLSPTAPASTPGAGPTSVATELSTPARPLATGSPTPITPCTNQACAAASGHLWLDRPIPVDSGYVDYVDRSYPYGSTQGGLRDVHHGVEFFNRTGTPVIAAGAGRVVVAGEDNTVAYGPRPSFYGKLVVVELDQRLGGQAVFNLYGHMSSVSVRVGDRVEAGALLGAVGSTGIAIGPHLHFEVRVGQNGYSATRNPELWLLPLLYNGQPQGVIAGQVVDRAGNPIPDVTVVIQPIDTESDRPRNRYIQTYSAQGALLNSDEALQENFAVGDVPPGLYSVSVSTTRIYEQTVTVSSGQVAWVLFVVNPPEVTPTPAFSETPAAPTPTVDPAAVTPTWDPNLPTPTLDPAATAAESATPEVVVEPPTETATHEAPSETPAPVVP